MRSASPNRQHQQRSKRGRPLDASTPWRRRAILAEQRLERVKRKKVLKRLSDKHERLQMKTIEKLVTLLDNGEAG